MDAIFCFLLSFLQFSCKRSSPRLWNARQGKGKLWRRGQQDHSWMSYKKQIWNPCLLTSQHIWGLLWVHQELHLDGTTVQSVVVLQTTRAWGVEHGSVLAAVKSYTMIHAAWNLWLDQQDIQATLHVKLILNCRVSRETGDVWLALDAATLPIGTMHVCACTCGLDAGWLAR